MPESTNVPHVYAAINAVQAALAKAGITKDRRNQQGAGYNFRGIDDIYNALAPLLAEHKLVILPRATERSQEERQAKSGGALFYTTVKMEFDLVSAVDGTRHTVATYGEAMDSSDKSTNKAMSAAYKYAAFQAFCIPTEGDNDADAHSPEVSSSKASNGSKSNGTGTSGAATGNGGKVFDVPISEASIKKLEELEKTAAGKEATRMLLSCWKIPDFSKVNEGEARDAIAWIADEVKRLNAKPAASK